MQQIEFHYLDTDFRIIDTNQYQNWLFQIATNHEIPIENLQFIFCSDDELLELNKSYLEHDYFTDILSFPFNTNPIAGDIYISVDRVKDNANKYNIPFLNEVLRVMAHGLLHFLGYDDHDKEDIIAMREAEEVAIQLFLKSTKNLHV